MSRDRKVASAVYALHHHYTHPILSDCQYCLIPLHTRIILPFVAFVCKIKTVKKLVMTVNK